MDYKFQYKHSKITIGDIKECRSFFSKVRGLMFRRKLQNLVFVFKKPVKIRIHSFFVKHKFLAIWLRKCKVVDAKIIEPWCPWVMPRERFDTLLEIPFESEKQISGFSSVIRKI